MSMRLKQVMQNISIVEENIAALSVELEGLKRISYIFKESESPANKKFAELRKHSLQQRKKALRESIDILCASMKL